jgi:hypothetical protein
MLLHEISGSPLPVIVSRVDSYSIPSRILSRKVKTPLDDAEKIARIQNLISSHVNVPRILEKLDCRVCIRVEDVFPETLTQPFRSLLIPAHEVSAAPHGEDSSLHRQ